MTDQSNTTVASGQPLAVTVTFMQRETKAWFGGKLVGKVADRLGSIGRYYPYGDDKGSGNPANGTEKFATYTRDTETGLDYADQRYHAPGTGRFMTADPYKASGGAGDPGSWNRYGYVGGDPVNWFDPSGQWSCPPPNPEGPRDCSPPSPGPDPKNPNPSPCLGACDPQPPSGGPSFTELMRAKAKKAIQNMSATCKEVIGSKWNLASFRDKVDDVTFLDGTQPGVAAMPLASLGRPPALTSNIITVADFMNAFPDVLGFVSIDDPYTPASRPGNRIVITLSFPNKPEEEKDALLIHEVLHSYTGLFDQQLADKFNLSYSEDHNNGLPNSSEALQAFLKNGCNKKP